MSKRFLVEVSSTPNTSAEWIDVNLLDRLHRTYDAVGLTVTELKQGEVIGNLAEFIKAAQEAAKTIPAPIIKLETASVNSETLEALRQACDKLFHIAEGIHSKKLKKFTQKLFDVYTNNDDE